MEKTAELRLYYMLKLLHYNGRNKTVRKRSSERFNTHRINTSINELGLGAAGLPQG